MDGRGEYKRYLILMILVGVLILACVVRLFDLQVVHGEKYRQTAEQRLVRAYPVKAPRGEILDRYEKAFVKNRMGYTVQFQKMDISEDDLNQEILAVARIVEECGGELVAEFPVSYSADNQGWRFSYLDTKGVQEIEEEALDDKAVEEWKKQRKTEFQKWIEDNKLEEYNTPLEIMDYFRNRYGVAGRYTEEEVLTIVSVRHDMEKTGFSDRTPYIMARDIEDEAVQKIKEQGMGFPGVEIEIEPVRVYAEGNSAAHILGRTGIIYAEEYQELKEQGYGMNDIIGKDGLEKILEPYLRGTDGYKSVSMSRAGGVNEILASQPVEPGNYVKLTLDLELQKAMEKSLQENITAAVDRYGAGGAIAIVPGTGEVLAIASYPTYNPETFDEDYEELLQAKSKPLFNRVLNGTYSPGSTLKPLTAIAGLENGVIQPDTYIADRGKYTYFDSYQPTCLIYSSSGGTKTHGTIEVAEALGVSCNYFFFEVGRLAGIEELNRYAEGFGLGEETGIELAESKGQMAGPELREKNGGIWYPGDVIQTAIGQSDSLFTPAQLANYIATVLNKGKRYRLHLVNEIVDYDSHKAVKKTKPELLEELAISDSTLSKVTEGMRRVVTGGTAKDAFKDSKYKAAGKTGTAEVPGGRDNVLFVGFAPYENPEIVVAVVIEHGANSHFAAKVARDVFDAYMELKEERSNPESASTSRIKDRDEENTQEKTTKKKENQTKGSGGISADQGKIPETATEPNQKEETGGNGTL